MTQWDFQNKGKSGWIGTSSFVLEVPLCHLRPSVIYSVPCDQILQRAYCYHESNRNLNRLFRLHYHHHHHHHFLLAAIKEKLYKYNNLDRARRPRWSYNYKKAIYLAYSRGNLNYE